MVQGIILQPAIYRVLDMIPSNLIPVHPVAYKRQAASIFLWTSPRFGLKTSFSSESYLHQDAYIIPFPTEQASYLVSEKKIHGSWEKRKGGGEGRQCCLGLYNSLENNSFVQARWSGFHVPLNANPPFCQRAKLPNNFSSSKLLMYH